MALLEVNNLSKAFGGLEAIKKVTFEINEGEILGLIGPNGAGKTTLFNLITGFLHPDTGKVLFRSQDITSFKPDKICKMGIGRTFQIPKPFANLSFLWNVKLGALLHTKNIEKAEHEAIEILDFFGLSNKCDKSCQNLTSVELKQLELARALATKPKLLILDEIAAGCNPEESAKLITLINKIHTQMHITLFIIEHVMRVIMSISDRIVVLNLGQKIAEGTPKEIVEDESVIKAYLGKKKN